MGLNFGVDFLLLIGANRLSGYPLQTKSAAAAAAMGGIYSGLCFVRGLRFLGGGLWRLLILGAMGVVAFGPNRTALRRTAVFILLSLALGGIAVNIHCRPFLTLLLGAGGIGILCKGAFGSGMGRRFIPITAEWNGRKVKLNALLDTGNGLRDPVSGEPVLVIGSRAATELTGMTEEALLRPMETLYSGKYRGLRLIPYTSVGKAKSMMVGMKLKNVWWNGVQRSTVVAFSPTELDGNGEFNALAGGA